MAVRDLLRFFRKRGVGVQEVMDLMGYDSSEPATPPVEVQTPSQIRSEVEEADRLEAYYGPSYDARSEAQLDPVEVHPARGTAQAMGERWAAEGASEALDGDTCLECGSRMATVLYACPDCRGCSSCCACLLTVGLA